MSFETMSQGAFSDLVADLKGRLIFLGLLPPPVDNWFDDKTEAAVKAYQSQVGHSLTGSVDASLWAQLASDTDPAGYTLEQAMAGAYDANFSPVVVKESAPPPNEHEADPAEIRNVLRDLSTRVKALAGDQARAIDSACKHFAEDYARRRIKELDQRITGEDYGKYLTRHITGTAGVGLTKLLSQGLSLTPVGPAGTFVITSVWIAFSMSTERRVASAVHDSLSDRAGFEEAITRLCMTVPDQVDAATDELKEKLDAEIDVIFAKLKRHEKLDAETMAWINPLLTAGPSATDTMIEKVFGIPTNKEGVRIAVFEMLVEAFEQMVLDKFDTPGLLEEAVTPLVQRWSPGRDVALDAQRNRQRDHSARAHQAAEEAAKSQRRRAFGPGT